ncbi:MAG: hypothetical protein IJB74_05935 [Clostridia bacterium]|nr:hypothetical protein [Clostridia bacterium]
MQEVKIKKQRRAAGCCTVGCSLGTQGTTDDRLCGFYSEHKNICSLSFYALPF